jgi:hypothetical protein
MAIFFLNKSFASELRPSQLHAVFTRLQDAMGLILVKLSNLTQLDLTVSRPTLRSPSTAANPVSLL